VPRKTQQRRTRGRPPKGTGPGLSRESVLRAALAVIDRGGLRALGTRKLAAQLGVAPNALYSYVSDKDDLIRGAIATLLEGMALPSLRARSWKISARDTCLWFRTQLLLHPNVVAASDGTLPFVPIFVAVGRILSSGGFHGKRLVEATFALSYHTIGFVSLEVTRYQRVAALEDRTLVTGAAKFQRADDPTETSILLPFVRDLNLDAVFERGLNAILNDLASPTKKPTRARPAPRKARRNKTASTR